MSKLGKEIAAGNQPMFMTPGEISEHFSLGDSPVIDRMTTPAMKKTSDQQSADKETLDYKLKDAQHPQSYDGKTSLYDSIKTEGIQSPISVGRSPYMKRPIVIDGHHRLAVAHNLNPNQFLHVEY